MRLRDAELRAQLAIAATVMMSCVLGCCVDSVTVTVLEPTGTVAGPVHAGEPVHPGKLAR